MTVEKPLRCQIALTRHHAVILTRSPAILSAAKDHPNRFVAPGRSRPAGAGRLGVWLLPTRFRSRRDVTTISDRSPHDRGTTRGRRLSRGPVHLRFRALADP